MTERQSRQMLLTEQDIVEMTGYKTAKKQREIMLKWGLPYRVRTDGTIMTTWPAINNALQNPQYARPNLQALIDRGNKRRRK